MIAAIIQARTGSTRLPNKIFAEIQGRPFLWHVVHRLKPSKKVDKIIIATTTNSNDDSIEEWASENSVTCFRGSENDVLSRYFEAAKANNVKVIVRVTADDPFKDSTIIDSVISQLETQNLDFSFNNNPPSFPEGLDVEVFTFDALKKAHENSKDPFEREHVTQFFYRNPDLFKMKNLSYKENLSYLRWTVDTENDLEMARQVYAHLFSKNRNFSFLDILALLEEHPEIAEMNSSEKRSTMYQKIHP
ncbi:MAG: cytidyltransferase [Bacteriovoracia bacterium]